MLSIVLAPPAGQHQMSFYILSEKELSEVKRYLNKENCIDVVPFSRLKGWEICLENKNLVVPKESLWSKMG